MKWYGDHCRIGSLENSTIIIRGTAGLITAA